MHDLALAEELDGIVDVGIVRQTQNVVVGHPCLLLGGKILVEIGDHVALDREILRVKGNARGCNGVHTRGVIHKVGSERRTLDLLLAEITGELVEDGADHLQVRELLTTLRSIGNVP